MASLTRDLSRFPDPADEKLLSHSIEEKLRKRINELATLNEIGNAISKTTKINKLIELIYQQTMRIMEVSAFYIALYDKKRNEMHFIFDMLHGKRQKNEETKRKFGNGRTEYIIRTKKPLLIKKNPHQTYQRLGIITGDKKAKACVGVPLIYANKAIGALVVQSYNVDHAYDEGHINVLTTIANQAAIAIENARLFEKIRNELNERKIIEKRLKERNEDLILAKKDTDNILNNVKDGLFLLDREFRISSQYSASLEKIFEEKKLAGKKITDYLNKKVSKKTIDMLKDFLVLSFDHSVDENSLGLLNPLSQIKVEFKTGKINAHNKYLTFDFRRIFSNNQISTIIVSVNDISQQILLEKSLAESKEQNKKHMEWLFTILNVDSQMLEEFMKSCKEEITHIKSIFKQDLSRKSINDIYRSVHLIKGNASMLGLTFMTSQTHAVEEALLLLREKPKAYTETEIQLNELFDMYYQVEDLIDRIGNFHSQFRPTRKHETEVLFKSISNLIQSLCKKYDKEAKLGYKQYDVSIVPPHHRLLIRDILVQLIRNSLVHGIENPDDRVKKNKPRQGLISISNARDVKWFYLIVRDDGKGIQIDKIKSVAKKSGEFKSADIDKWSRSRIIELIYSAGITTAEQADFTAGRGMGMDLIKNKVEKHGGSIFTETEAGVFTQFTIKIPVEK